MSVSWTCAAELTESAYPCCVPSWPLLSQALVVYSQHGLLSKLLVEQCCEALCGLQDIIDGLPALMDNIRMMHTIARYYSTAERMTTLFIKITNQMITKCKEHINPDVRKPEKLWKLSKPELIESMQVRFLLRVPCLLMSP